MSILTKIYTKVKTFVNYCNKLKFLTKVYMSNFNSNKVKLHYPLTIIILIHLIIFIIKFT